MSHDGTNVDVPQLPPTARIGHWRITEVVRYLPKRGRGRCAVVRDNLGGTHTATLAAIEVQP